MKFETYLLLALIVYGIWTTNRSVKRTRTPRERFFVVRSSIFGWFVGVVLLAAILFLPIRVLLLMAIPVMFGVVAVGRLLRDARNRLRQEGQARVDIERMKRVN